MTHDIFSTAFGDTLVRFFICLFVNWFIVHFLYFKKGKRRDFYFTFVIISVAIYFLVYLMMGMDRGKATMGVGLGLFGIFSIMRYRTDSMPVREMTYLFVLISLSVVNALGSTLSLAELLTTNLIVVAAIWLCERFLRMQPVKLVQYDRIELIAPDRYADLKADLEQRLGLQVKKVEVGAVDFLRDTAMLKIYYVGDDKHSNGVDTMLKMPKVTLL